MQSSKRKSNKQGRNKQKRGKGSNAGFFFNTGSRKKKWDLSGYRKLKLKHWEAIIQSPKNSEILKPLFSLGGDIFFLHFS